MTTDRVEDFLKAESEANRLIDELLALTHETESYQKASENLEAARNDIAQLSARLGEIAIGIRASVDTLNQIGMPALLDGQKAIQQSISSLQSTDSAIRSDVQSLRQESLPKLHEGLETIRDGSTSASQTVLSKLGVIQQLLTVGLGGLGLLMVIILVIIIAV